MVRKCEKIRIRSFGKQDITYYFIFLIYLGILFPSTKERIAGRRNDNYNIEEDLDNLWFQVSKSLPDELVKNLSENMADSSKSEINLFENDTNSFRNEATSLKNEKDSFQNDENVSQKITILTKNSGNESKTADTTRYSILESKKKAEKRIINNAKKFSCCFSKNKNLNCKMIPKNAKKSSKKKFKSSELECVYDLMYDIKVSYPGEPVPRGPRYKTIYKI